MSTETKTTDTTAGSAKSRAKSWLEPLGVNALLASFIIQYALAVMVLDEVLGDTLAEASKWVVIGANSALAIPIITVMVLAAGYCVELLTGEPADWRELTIYGAAAGAVVSPVWTWLFYSGVI